MSLSPPALARSITGLVVCITLAGCGGEDASAGSSANFADFTEPSTFERFRVQWIQTPRGLRMIVNPFGPGPAYYDCVLTRAEAL